MESIICRRIDYYGVGALRGQRHIPNQSTPRLQGQNCKFLITPLSCNSQKRLEHTKKPNQIQKNDQKASESCQNFNISSVGHCSNKKIVWRQTRLEPAKKTSCTVLQLADVRYLTHYIFFGLFSYSYTLSSRSVTVLTLWVAPPREMFYNRPFARRCHFYYCASLIKSDNYFETLTPFIKSWTKQMENLYSPLPLPNKSRMGKRRVLAFVRLHQSMIKGGMGVYCSINFYSVQGCRFAKEFRIPVPGLPDAFPTSFPRLSPTRPYGAIERDRETRAGERTWERG